MNYIIHYMQSFRVTFLQLFSQIDIATKTNPQMAKYVPNTPVFEKLNG